MILFYIIILYRALLSIDQHMCAIRIPNNLEWAGRLRFIKTPFHFPPRTSNIVISKSPKFKIFSQTVSSLHLTSPRFSCFFKIK